MTFDAIPAGEAVFIDANVFLYYFTAHSRFGPACKRLIERVAEQTLSGITSTQVLGEVVHRLMTIEASQRFGWPATGIARRLRSNRAEVQQLSRHIQALDEITLLNIETVATQRQHVSVAADEIRRFGLLYSDAR